MIFKLWTVRDAVGQRNKVDRLFRGGRALIFPFSERRNTLWASLTTGLRSQFHSERGRYNQRITWWNCLFSVDCIQQAVGITSFYFAMAFEKYPASCGKWRLCGRPVWPLLLFLWCLSHSVSGQIRYTIPEELKRGSLIGNVAQDLGLDVQRLRSGRARIVTRQSIQYTELKTDKGILVVNERIDREQLCGDVTPCSFSFEVILENPMELHRVTV